MQLCTPHLSSGLNDWRDKVKASCSSCDGCVEPSIEVHTGDFFGHVSEIYVDIFPLAAEARTLFPATDPACEGETYRIEPRMNVRKR